MPLARSAVASLTLLALATLARGASAGACTPDFAPVERELNAARARWTASRTTVYNFRLARTCLCDARLAGPFRVRVEDGAIRAAIYQGAAEGGIPDGTRVGEADLANVYTIDQMFNLVAAAIAKKVCSVQVSYDAVLGHPTKIDIDFDKETADEELRLTVSDVRTAAAFTKPAR